MPFVNNDGFIYSFLIFVLVRTSDTILNRRGDKGIFIVQCFVIRYDICGRLL